MSDSNVETASPSDQDIRVELITRHGVAIVAFDQFDARKAPGHWHRVTCVNFNDHAKAQRLYDSVVALEKPVPLIEVAESPWRDLVASLRGSISERISTIADLIAEVERLTGELSLLKVGYSLDNDDVCQTLGRVLGYPWFKDDQVNFPGATVDNGVCVGDHVAPSIAAEAATVIATLRVERDRLKSENASLSAIVERLGDMSSKLDAAYCSLADVRMELGVRNEQFQLANANTAAVIEINARLARENATMRKALTEIMNAATEWCEAVDRGTAWDNWDRHFKNMKWSVLDHVRAALAQLDVASADASADLATKQEPLGEEFAEVLYDNLWELADGDTRDHTDLMISPEAIDEALATNPLPALKAAEVEVERLTSENARLTHHCVLAREALYNARVQIRVLGTPDDAVNNAVLAQIDASLVTVGNMK
jgi:hypothetical protein